MRKYLVHLEKIVVGGGGGITQNIEGVRASFPIARGFPSHKSSARSLRFSGQPLVFNNTLQYRPNIDSNLQNYCGHLSLFW